MNNQMTRDNNPGVSNNNNIANNPNNVVSNENTFTNNPNNTVRNDNAFTNNQSASDAVANNNNVMRGQVKQGLGGRTLNQPTASAGNNSGVSASMLKKMPKSAKNNPKYTENWINVKSINNGIIYNTSNEMVTGVKIRPKNIFILDQSEMDNTLIGLMNFYNTIDYEFWIMVADRPVDIAMYQAELQLLYNKTTDQRVRKLISQDMDKGDFFMNNNVVDTEYYLLFKEKKMDLLQKKIRNIINGLAGAGLIASQTSNDDLRMIIDNFLNGGRKFESGTVMVE